MSSTSHLYWILLETDLSSEDLYFPADTPLGHVNPKRHYNLLKARHLRQRERLVKLQVKELHDYQKNFSIQYKDDLFINKRTVAASQVISGSDFLTTQSEAISNLLSSIPEQMIENANKMQVDAQNEESKAKEDELLGILKKKYDAGFEALNELHQKQWEKLSRIQASDMEVIPREYHDPPPPTYNHHRDRTSSKHHRSSASPQYHSDRKSYKGTGSISPPQKRLLDHDDASGRYYRRSKSIRDDREKRSRDDSRDSRDSGGKRSRDNSRDYRDRGYRSRDNSRERISRSRDNSRDRISRSRDNSRDSRDRNSRDSRDGNSSSSRDNRERTNSNTPPNRPRQEGADRPNNKYPPATTINNTGFNANNKPPTVATTNTVGIPTGERPPTVMASVNKPPTVGISNDRAPPTVSTSNNRAPPTVGTSNNRGPPIVGTSNSRGPPTVSASNGRGPPTVGTSNGRGPPIVGTSNGRGPPSVGAAPSNTNSYNNNNRRDSTPLFGHKPINHKLTSLLDRGTISILKKPNRVIIRGPSGTSTNYGDPKDYDDAINSSVERKDNPVYKRHTQGKDYLFYRTESGKVVTIGPVSKIQPLIHKFFLSM